MSRPACDCSLIIPTRNRCTVLAETLGRLRTLPDTGFEIIVADNGSTDAIPSLASEFPDVRWIFLGANLGCAARNVAAAAASGRVLFMLDDDSWPEPGSIERAVRLLDRRSDLAAAACRVWLAEPAHRHDAGGVPGIFFNCGGAVRRDAFLAVGGYPIDFDYYVEEYDLACRLWQRGHRIEPFGDIVVHHARCAANRDNNRMMRFLVRNNLRLWHRYAPLHLRADLVESTLERYRRVALKEHALDGFHAGLEEGRRMAIDDRHRARPLSEAEYAGLFGLDVAARTIQTWADNHCAKKVAVWGRGKGCEQLLALLATNSICVDAVYDRNVECGQFRGECLRDESHFRPRDVDGIVVGTLSPGVAEDLCGQLRSRFAGLPVVSAAPWRNSRDEAIMDAISFAAGPSRISATAPKATHFIGTAAI
jgi:GT2 family glycosyltransferase